MLNETIKVDLIELTEFNTIQIRTATIIERDGVEISKSYHRHVINPGDDYSQEDPKVQAIANAIWTQEVIDSYMTLQQNIRSQRNITIQ
jgi:hypothetical protein